MKRKKLPVITKKLLTTIICSGFILCTIVFSAGYYSFSRQFRTQYDASIRSIAAAANACLNPDDFQKYIATKKADKKYEAISKILQDFVDKFDLNVLYVSHVQAPDYSHITYIYNCVSKNGKYNPFPLGYEENYFEAGYNASTKKVFEEGKICVRHTLKTRSGSHITAQYPVYNSEGKVVAVIGAQKSIQEFVNARHSFTIVVIVIELCFAIIFIILFVTYFNACYIRPIVLVTREADHFASYGGKPDDKLLKIRNKDEIGTLAHTIHQMEYDVCRNMEEITRMTAEKQRISTELNLAAKIQEGMLPTGYPPFPEEKTFDLFATMAPAREVGGDLYDYIMIDKKHLLLVVGDVSGKGITAALFMAKCKVLINLYAKLNLSPGEIFEKTNEELCKGNYLDLFVTCWLGIFSLDTGVLTFVNAGHPYPLLYNKADDIFSLLKEKPNLVLAGMEKTKYTEHQVRLHKGDRLFVYTDGVTEATNSREELFGEARLLKAMEGTQKLDAAELLADIRKKIDDFTAEAEQFDDITMMSFEWRDNGKN